MIYVIGSGPAGTACAHRLVQNGLKVVMLDAGVELEQEKEKIIKDLQETNEEQWDSNLVNKIKGEMDAKATDGPLKLSYGSDYPYKEVQDHMPITSRGVLCRPSFAKGGLSSVWGASVMPYSKKDIESWPISISELAPYYKEVLKFMKIACFEDDLAAKFPLYTEDHDTFTHSRQAELLLEVFKKNKKKLNDNGIIFGNSRLAVKFSSSNSDKNKKRCTYLGMCLYGCPYKLIYSTADTLEELKKCNNFKYISNVIVDKIVEKDNKSLIIAHDKTTNESIKFIGNKTFLACGTISSTRIMLASMNSYDMPLTIKDSQHFFFPCLMYKYAGDVTKERLHTLCQLNIEIDDKKIDNHDIHLQIYTYLDLYESALKKMMGPFYNIFKVPLKFILGRIILIKGYLHSDSSSRVSIMLIKKPGKEKDEVILEKIENPVTDKKVKRIAMKLFKNQFLLRLIPMISFLKISKPGGGNHYGGSFPMSNKPKMFESDRLGRPFGFKNLHIVDASIFPSIAAQTITLTIMANACRIADNYDKK